MTGKPTGIAIATAPFAQIFRLRKSRWPLHSTVPDQGYARPVCLSKSKFRLLEILHFARLPAPSTAQVVRLLECCRRTGDESGRAHDRNRRPTPD